MIKNLNLENNSGSINCALYLYNLEDISSKILHKPRHIKQFLNTLLGLYDNPYYKLKLKTFKLDFRYFLLNQFENLAHHNKTLR